MSVQLLRVAGLATAAVPALGLGFSGIPDAPTQCFLLLLIAFGLCLGPMIYLRRTYRVSGRMAALFLGVNAPIAAFMLLTPRKQESPSGSGWSPDGSQAAKEDVLRVPLVHLFGGSDQPAGSEAFATLDIIAGVSLGGALLWGVALYAAVLYVRRRTGGAGTEWLPATGISAWLGYRPPPGVVHEIQETGRSLSAPGEWPSEDPPAADPGRRRRGHRS